MPSAAVKEGVFTCFLRLNLYFLLVTISAYHFRKCEIVTHAPWQSGLYNTMISFKLRSLHNAQKANQDCFVDQVSDAGPVLDMMAVMLENIASTPVVARSTAAAVYRTAQIIASVPNLQYQNKVYF